MQPPEYDSAEIYNEITTTENPHFLMNENQPKNLSFEQYDNPVPIVSFQNDGLETPIQTDLDNHPPPTYEEARIFFLKNFEQDFSFVKSEIYYSGDLPPEYYKCLKDNLPKDYIESDYFLYSEFMDPSDNNDSDFSDMFSERIFSKSLINIMCRYINYKFCSRNALSYVACLERLIIFLIYLIVLFLIIIINQRTDDYFAFLVFCCYILFFKFYLCFLKKTCRKIYKNKDNILLYVLLSACFTTGGLFIYFTYWVIKIFFDRRWLGSRGINRINN